ncbi:MAG: cobyric acid synthase [Corynebacterium sp.]|nr:cobyric acid synthase [Corynebacterium sp.]
MNAVLIAGLTSDAGKSVVVAGLCRALYRRGFAVAPFKAQNMSNNSDVTADGGEIGRAQSLQAVASGLAPSVAFNPILLKPGSDRQSQLIVRGQATGFVSAKNYIEHRQYLRAVASEELAKLRAAYDVVICEGAGSPAEINLRETDVANMGLAQAADLPVLLVGDIDRGGVLAHFFGTHQILEPKDQARIKGFIVNKFRGDQSILNPGLEELQRRTGVPTVAVLPFISSLWVDAEDSLQSSIGKVIGPPESNVADPQLEVAAIRLPRISNATDVEALACEPGITVRWVDDAASVTRADLVVLPGSKSTVSDLAWLRERGIATALEQRAQANKVILGICGGFQMLCRSIVDPVEAKSEQPVAGLGLFDIDIAFAAEKTVVRHDKNAFEVHHGQVIRSAETPWVSDEGARKGHIFGTHIHGWFEADTRRKAWLREVFPDIALDDNASFAGMRDAQLNTLADVLEEHWDLDAFIAALEITKSART